jgi:diaminopimelate decarboxylase
MDHFHYRGALLHCEDVAIDALAAEYGTPLFVYSQRTLVEHYERMAAAFSVLDPWICFSVKSCQNLAILRLLRERGSAFDVVSGGEMARVLEAGGDPSRIVFAGVGKTDSEIEAALRAGIGWFNAESEEELENLSAIASRMGTTAHVALRVNPDVDPKTHKYTTTGKHETKFGVDIERARAAFAMYAKLPGLDLSAIHLHIGSPVNTIDPYVQSITKGVELIDELRRDGFDIRAINIGGGFGAHYDGDQAPTAADYAAKLVPLLSGRDLAVLMEPGRSIAANAGVLIGRVLYRKGSGHKQFLITDASMTELIRPALYEAFHFVWPVAPKDASGAPLPPPSRTKALHLPGTTLVDVVGPVCESSDFLAKDRYLPAVARGELLCIFTTGAYGMVMSSQYNSRPRAAEVLVDGKTARLIRRRETYEDLVAGER